METPKEEHAGRSRPHLAVLSPGAEALAREAAAELRFLLRGRENGAEEKPSRDEEAMACIARRLSDAAACIRAGHAKQAVLALKDPHATLCAERSPEWAGKISGLLSAVWEARTADLPPGCADSANHCAIIAGRLREAADSIPAGSVRDALRCAERACGAFEEGAADAGISQLEQTSAYLDRAREAASPRRGGAGSSAQASAADQVRWATEDVRKELEAAIVMHMENTRGLQEGMFPIRLTWNDGQVPRTEYLAVSGSRRRATVVTHAIRNGARVDESSTARPDLAGSPEGIRTLLAAAHRAGWETLLLRSPDDSPATETVRARLPGTGKKISQTWAREGGSILREMSPEDRAAFRRKLADRAARSLEGNLALIGEPDPAGPEPGSRGVTRSARRPAAPRFPATSRLPGRPGR